MPCRKSWTRTPTSARFSGHALFRAARFSYAIFGAATFSEEAIFAATFSRTVDFVNAKWVTHTIFTRATFDNFVPDFRGDNA